MLLAMLALYLGLSAGVALLDPTAAPLRISHMKESLKTLDEINGIVAAGTDAPRAIFGVQTDWKGSISDSKTLVAMVPSAEAMDSGQFPSLFT